jgi:hypothetical protein
MKKTPRKLVLRSEIVRSLANMDLMRAVGGFGSGAEPCQVVFDTGKKDCESQAAVIPTAACR